jgi:multiple sugar transport system substrate-binding protein
MGSKQALTALELMRSLFTDGVSPTSVLQDQEPSDNDAFDNREAAFLRGWDASYALAESRTSRVRGDVGVAPLPRLTGSSGAGYSTIGGWDLFINPHSTHVAADVTFVNWLTGEQAQRILASQYTEIPANVAVRQDQRVAAGNPVLTAARANTGALVSRPTRLADYPSVSHDIFTAVHAALAAPAKPSGGADDAALCRSLVDAAHQIDPGVTTMRCDDLAGDGG